MVCSNEDEAVDDEADEVEEASSLVVAGSELVSTVAGADVVVGSGLVSTDEVVGPGVTASAAT